MRAGPFAGTPAPTGSPQFQDLHITCGSGRARENLSAMAKALMDDAELGMTQ